MNAAIAEGSAGLTPLASIMLTVAAYSMATRLHRTAGKHALLTPVLIAIVLVAAALAAFGLLYEHYFNANALLHAMLPAAFALLTVAIWRHAASLGRHAVTMVLVSLIGAVASVAGATLIATLSTGDRAIVASASVRGVTTPLAVPLAEAFGGLASLTACIVIVSGVAAAAFGPLVLRLCSVTDPRAIGLALGISGQALGTAQAFRSSERAGAFAVVGMVISAGLGIVAAIIALETL